MAMREVVLCAPVRTAIGTYNGSLKATPATDLGATVVREISAARNLIRRSCAPWSWAM